MPETQPPGSDDAGRELAARRRDLEQEFDAKLRDLKAQQKRVADKLQQDRIDWEASRREQQRDLADRTEKLRRQEDNHKRDLEALRATRRDLDGAKAAAQENAGAKAQAKAALAKESGLKARLEAAQDLLGWFAVVAVGGSGAVLAAAFLTTTGVVIGISGLGLALATLLEWRRRRWKSLR